MLLLAFPELKADPGPVTTALQQLTPAATVMAVWQNLVHQDIQPLDEGEDF